MKKRQSVPFIILLAAFLSWLYFKPQKELAESPKHQPNYVAYKINNTHFDLHGRVSHKIFSDKTISFTESDKTIFENPRMVIYSENEQQADSSIWQITSKEGTLYEQNKMILSGDVWVKNLSLDQLIQTMNTEELTILIDQKEISNDLLVTWTGPQMHQQGVGLWGSLVSEELIVKDKIKTVYLNEKN